MSWKDQSKIAWKNAWKNENIGGTLGSLGNGLTSVISSGISNAQVADTSSLEENILDTASTEFNYEDFDSLLGAYNNFLPEKTSYTRKDVRGVTGGQMALNTISGVGSGALTGLSVGGPWGAVAGAAIGLGSGLAGIFTGNAKASKQANKLNVDASAANQRVLAGIASNSNNISEGMFNNAAVNMAAEGGKIKTSLPKYNGFTDYFAYGGGLDLSGDFTNGVTIVKEGGSHEDNKYEGVPMGMDENGIPNLVEEGEVIYNDYVFSRRLKPTESQLREVLLNPKYEGKTFAEIATLIQKESSENPFDPISRNTLDDGMMKLMTIQESTRQEKELKRFKREFNKLPYTEKKLITNMLMEQSQQQLEPKEQQEMQQEGTPRAYNAMEEELASYNNEGAPVTGVEEYAEGGLVNKFSPGGRRYTRNARKPEVSAMQAWLPVFNRLVENISAAKDKEEVESLISGFNKIQDLYRTAANDYYNDENVKLQDLPSVRALQEEFDRQGYNVFNDDFTSAGATGDHYDTWDIDGLFGATTELRNLGIKPSEIDSSSEKTFLDLLKTLNNKLNSYGYSYRPSSNKDDIINGNPLMRINPANLIQRITPITKVLYNTALRVAPNGELYNPSDARNPNNLKLNIPSREGKVESSKYPTPNWLTYTPAIGSGLAVLGDILGNNRPDYSNINRAARQLNGVRNIYGAHIGPYMAYNPFDINYEQNRLANQSLNTRNAILASTSGNRGAALAALLTLNNDTNNQAGDLLRKGLEYNDTLRKTVTGFNRDTDIQNANFSMQAQQANQSADLQRANMAMNEAQYRDQLRTQSSQVRSANYNNFLTNLGNAGRTKYSQDQLNWLLSKGYIPGITASSGGKIKRQKRGLTF